MTEQENSILWNSYFYPGTTTLRNYFNIKDKDKLKKAEITHTAAILLELRDKPIEMNYDKNHLSAIHRYLFEEIYPFAGEYRKVNMGKEDTTFLMINKPQDIERALDELFYETNEALNNCSNKMDFCEILANLYTQLIHIHPFREGNGRTTREFIREFSLNKSKELNLGELTIDFNKINKEELNEYVKVAHLFPGQTAFIFMDAIESNNKGRSM